MGVEWGGRDERPRKRTRATRRETMTSWQEQISDPAGLGVDHGEGESEVMASPEELADMFGVTDLTEISDTLCADYEAWMEDGGLDDDEWEHDAHRWTPPEHPTIEGGTWALIEQAEDPRRGPTEPGCGPGAPTEGHLVESEEEGAEPDLIGSPEDDRADVDEVPERVACGTCGRAVYWRGVNPGMWAHFDSDTDGHRAWVRG